MRRTPGGSWRVRWRADGKERSRTFRLEKDAQSFLQFVDSAPLEDLGPWLVFRAYCDVLPLGLYDSRAAAREHCVHDAAQHGDDVTAVRWEPMEDHLPDGEERLVLPDAPQDSDVSLYTVIPLELHFAFDPRAEG